jgi:hypothetical protein
VTTANGNSITHSHPDAAALMKEKQQLEADMFPQLLKLIAVNRQLAEV